MTRGVAKSLRRVWFPALTCITFAAAAAASAAGDGNWPAPAGTVPQLTVAPERAADKGLPAASGWQFESNTGFAAAGSSVAPLGDVNGDGFGDFAAGGAGAVRVFFGAQGGPPTSPSQTLTIAITSFGLRVAPAGDVNGDGYFDLLVSAPYAGDGRAYCYHGSAAGFSPTPNWTRSHLDAGFADAQFGLSLDSAGDVNGDGYDDVIIGIPFSGDGYGAAEVYHGGPAGLGATSSWWQYANGSIAYGTAVAGVGDVNADGYADVAVSVPGLNVFIGSSVFGLVYVFHGSASGLSFTLAGRTTGNQSGASYGAAVAGAGDVNGDGYADLVVGSPTFDYPGVTDAGRALIYPGSASGIIDAPIWEEWGVAANKQFGAAVASAGDVNGDGLADVAVGVPQRIGGAANNGSAYLVQGGTFPYISWSTNRFDAAGFGSALGTAGDVNGDGFGDLLVGSPLWDSPEGDEGRVEIFFGAANPPAPFAGQIVNGRQEDATFSYVTTSVGDVNGDGYTDAVVTAPDGDTEWYDEGFADLYYGSPGGLGYALSWGGPQDGSQFGYAAAAAGDVNGDGYGDLIIGAPNAGAGVAYLWHGGPAGPSGGAANWAVSLGTIGARFGHSVAAAGDVDGDGFGDVIVGAPRDDNGQVDEGRAFLFLGSASGLATIPAWIVEGNQDGALRGHSVAGAGDVNLDGYGDVIIGEPGLDRFFAGGFSQTDVGRASVFLGGAGGPPTSPVWSVRGSDSGKQFGQVVAGAGDVNGDGYSDLLVTSIGGAVGFANEGGAYVYLGGSAGPATATHWSYLGTQANAFVGWSASGGGDVDGDGLSDIILGVPNQDAGGRTDCGQALLFAGPLTGAAATSPLWSFTDQFDYQYAGRSVSAAGDYNGDGFADILTGSPGFTQDYIFQGRFFVFWGNGLYNATNSLIRAGQQRRGDDSAPVALLGRTSSPPALRLKALGGSAAGRTKVRLEWEIKPIAALTDGLGLGRGAWTDNGGSPAYAPPVLDSGSLGLPLAPTAHWRLRVASRSPYFPSTPWISVAGNGRQEGDLSARNAALASVDSPARLSPQLLVSVAPNPFNPRTTLAFEMPRDGRARVELFDTRGRLIGVVLDQVREAGRVELSWDGRDGEGRPVGSGIYWARVSAAGVSGVAKLVLVR